MECSSISSYQYRPLIRTTHRGSDVVQDASYSLRRHSLISERSRQPYVHELRPNYQKYTDGRQIYLIRDVIQFVAKVVHIITTGRQTCIS